MKTMNVEEKKQNIPDRCIPELGYLQRDGSNFLPAIVRLDELLSRTFKVERKEI